MASVLTLLVVLGAVFGTTAAARLQVSGTDLTYNGAKVFLNGVNIAWNSYGYDFGNGGYDGTLEQWVREVSSSGGNSIRVWVHVEGYSTPIFNPDGYVLKCDNSGQFEGDMLKLLNAAQSANVLVVPVLWNGAYLTKTETKNLIYDDSKLDSYINNCLNSLMNTIKGHPALGAMEVMNEPEGSAAPASDANYCYDTTMIGQSGAGWNNQIPMERLLRFIGRQNQAIRAIDPNVLITLGSWGQFPQSDAFFNTRQHYSDACLNGAAGGSNAHLNFYQMHTYDWGGSWSPNAPFTVNAGDYKLDKPLVIGEYAAVCGASTSLSNLFEYAYTHGYSGGWSWHYVATGDCTDSRATQQASLGQLRGRTDNGVVDINVG